jgi:hypothetical protein
MFTNFYSKTNKNFSTKITPVNEPVSKADKFTNNHNAFTQKTFNSNKGGLYEDIKYECKTWMSNTTFHGLKQIANYRLVFRLFWLLIVVASASYCTISVVNVIKSYLNYETTVEIKQLIESPTYFPAVTFCNLNPIDYLKTAETSEYLMNLTVSDYVIFALNSTLNQTLNPTIKHDRSTDPVTSAIARVSEIREYLKAYVTANLRTDEGRKAVGHSFEDFFVSCYWNGFKCFEHHFEWFYTHEYGSCYIFNGNALDPNNLVYRSNRAGVSNGLSVELFVGIGSKLL